MGRVIVTATVAGWVVACGPEVGVEEGTPGELVYEDSDTRLYRVDRRVDVVVEEEHGVRRECGILTERAFDELESTIGALDPSVDYGYDPEVMECDRPLAWVHIEGFEHSPFQCSWRCCRRELIHAAFVYSAVVSHFYGLTPSLEGEAYVAVEPESVCP